jgi:hypothetical protein
MRSKTSLHRGHRITVVEIGRTWDAIVYAPDRSILVSGIEGGTAQEAKVKAMRFVDAEIAKPTADVTTRRPV